MSITGLTASQYDANTYRVTPTSDEESPEYRYYVDGVLRETTARPWFDVSVSPGDQLRIEVFDDDTLPGDGFPARFRFTWQAVTGAQRYRIDRKVAGNWVQVAVRGDRGALEYETDPLEDDTEHEFRIVPVGANDGSPREVTVHMVRRPPAPELDRDNTTYDAETGTRTIALL